jgi:hypothetical protein
MPHCLRIETCSIASISPFNRASSAADLSAAAEHTTDGSPQNAALLDYQHALQTDYTGTVAVVEAEAAALIDGG